MATYNDGSEAEGYSYATPQSVQSDNHMSDVSMMTGKHKSPGMLQEGNYMGTGQQASLAPSESVQPHDSASYRDQNGWASNSNNASANSQAEYPSSVQLGHGQNLRYCFYDFEGTGYCMQPGDWTKEQWVAHLIDYHLNHFSSQELQCYHCQKSFVTSSKRKYDGKVKEMANHVYDHMIASGSKESTSPTPSNASSARYAGTGAQFQSETGEHSGTLDDQL